jgi:hypothetical protein
MKLNNGLRSSFFKQLLLMAAGGSCQAVHINWGCFLRKTVKEDNVPSWQ